MGIPNYYYYYYYYYYYCYYYYYWGTAVAQWLRCCATTNRKVAGSIPDGVIGIFHGHNPSDRTMALESTQPLTNEYQEYFLRAKTAGA